MSKIIIVDDTNTNIKYSGPWFITAQNSQLNVGNNGPPFQNTLHGTNENASLSYSFNGTQVIVLGTSGVTKSASGTQDPTWECFIDNISIGRNISAGEFGMTENNWVLCQIDQLQDGPHILSLKVTVLHQQTFWIDQIQFLPSSNVPLDNSTVRVDSSDLSIQYSSGWKESDGIVNLTQNSGSTIAYEFFGVSLSWVGFIPSNSSLIPSSGIYSIDGQSPISFFVPASGDSPVSLYNQVLFKTETLSPGQHKLIVTYQGNSETAPLALDAFIVQNATSTSSSAPSSSSSNIGSKKSLRAGIIAGVVVGVIVLFLLLLFYLARRSNRRAQNLKEILERNPEPFTLPRQTYFSDVPSLTPPAISRKFTRGREPAYPPGLSRPPPVIGTRVDPTYFAVRNTETIPPLGPSTSAQGGNFEFLQHADSGVRLPRRAQGKPVRVSLPPVYTSS